MEKIQEFNIGDRVRFIETGAIAEHSELIMGKSIFGKVYTIVKSNNGKTFTLNCNGEKCHLISAVQIEHANEPFSRLEIGKYVEIETDESKNIIYYVEYINEDSFRLNNGVIYNFDGLSHSKNLRNLMVKNSRVVRKIDAINVPIQITLKPLTLEYVSDTEIEFDGGICLLKSDLTAESIAEVERLFKRIEIEK